MSTPTPTTIDNLPTLTINALNTASTIDAVADYIPIYTASATATQGINRNTFLGLSSAPVGLTDTQTMSNKTLTSPTINGATLSGTLSGTYTIGGTPTFPSSVVTLTGTQALTNKTLTSPTINSPTILNATISADTVSGYTTSNSGTIYGVSVASGVIASAALAGAVNTAALAANAVTGAKIASYSTNRDNNGTNTTESVAKLQTGWAAATAGGTVSSLTATVTFPVAFSSAPIVVCVFGGDQIGGSIVYGSGGNNRVGTVSAKAYGVTTTGCTLYAAGGSSWSSGDILYWQWIAIGT
jgi:hypothetical protein